MLIVTYDTKGELEGKEEEDEKEEEKTTIYLTFNFML